MIREPDPPPPVPLTAAIAEAVHRAVAEFTGSDGYGHCYLYAVAGCTLARELTGRDYLLQAGSLRLLAAPPDGWLELRAAGPGLAGGRYHCWFAREAPGGGVAEVADLAARHYRRWCDSGPAPRWGWPAGAPDYLWQGGARSSWLGLVADPGLTADLAARAAAQAGGLAPLLRLARGHLGPR